MMEENNQPLVSVIIPVYNCVLYIDEAIESIICQTYKNLEIFIIDDGSSDGTKEKIEQWAKIDSRIHTVFKESNTGASESRNIGLQLSKGKYVALMDGDDISEKSRFQVQIDFLENNQKTIICGCHGKIIGTEEILSKPISNNQCKIRLFFGTPFINTSVMMRRDLFNTDLKIFDSQFDPCEDYDLFVRYSTFGDYYNIPKVLVYYRVHQYSISHVKFDKGLQSKKSIRNKYIEINNLKFEVNKLDAFNGTSLLLYHYYWQLFLLSIYKQGKHPWLMFYSISVRHRINNLNNIRKSRKHFSALIIKLYIKYLQSLKYITDFISKHK